MLYKWLCFQSLLAVDGTLFVVALVVWLLEQMRHDLVFLDLGVDVDSDLGFVLELVLGEDVAGVPLWDGFFVFLDGMVVGGSSRERLLGHHDLWADVVRLFLVLLHEVLDIVPDGVVVVAGLCLDSS